MSGNVLSIRNNFPAVAARLICCWARYLADLSALEIGLRVIIKSRPDKREKAA